MVSKKFDKTKKKYIDEQRVKRNHLLSSFTGDGSPLGDTEALGRGFGRGRGRGRGRGGRSSYQNTYNNNDRNCDDITRQIKNNNNQGYNQNSYMASHMFGTPRSEGQSDLSTRSARVEL